jgi:hypothetical protein
MEQMMLRMTELQPKIPSWAKAEQMEICTPQKELWKYADEPSRVTTKKRKRIQAGEVS